MTLAELLYGLAAIAGIIIFYIIVRSAVKNAVEDAWRAQKDLQQDQKEILQKSLIIAEAGLMRQASKIQVQDSKGEISVIPLDKWIAEYQAASKEYKILNVS